MPEIIEARVIQKVATEAEWNAITLTLYKGEIALVTDGDGKPINIKVGVGNKVFSELPYLIDYSQAAYIEYTATPSQPVAYTFVGEGTYGSITVDNGYMAVLGWNGTSWSKDSEMQLPMPTGTDVLDPDGNGIPKEKAVAVYVKPMEDKIDGIADGKLVGDPLESVDTGFDGVIQYTSSGSLFTGWGQMVGSPDEIDCVYIPKLKYTQSGYPITQIQVLLRIGGFNGAVIQEVLVPFSASLEEEKDVFIPFTRWENTLNEDIWVEVRTNGRMPRYNANIAVTGARFSTNTNISTRFTTSSSLVADTIGFYVMVGLSKTVPLPTSDFIDQIKDDLDITANLQGEVGKKYVVAACNVRTPLTVGGAYSIHEDAGHEASNIAWVAVSGDDLRVGMSFTAEKVITMSATPHTSLRMAGYEVSTTGGLSIHAVSFFKDGVKVPANEVDAPFASFWFYALMLV